MVASRAAPHLHLVGACVTKQSRLPVLDETYISKLDGRTEALQPAAGAEDQRTAAEPVRRAGLLRRMISAVASRLSLDVPS
jgi:hypothetical protein